MQAKMAGVRNRPIATKRSSGRTEELVLPLCLYAGWRIHTISYRIAMCYKSKRAPAANSRQRPKRFPKRQTHASRNSFVRMSVSGSVYT